MKKGISSTALSTNPSTSSKFIVCWNYDYINFKDNVYIKVETTGTTSVSLRFYVRDLVNNTFSLLQSRTVTISGGSTSLLNETFRKLQDWKFLYIRNGKYRVFNVTLDWNYTCSVEVAAWISLSTSSLTNIFSFNDWSLSFIVSNTSVFRRITFNSSGTLTHDTSELPLPVSATFYWIQLTDNRVAFFTTTQYFVVNWTTLNIEKTLTSLWVTLQASAWSWVWNNTLNTNGSNYFILTRNGSVHSWYLDSSNNLTLSSALTTPHWWGAIFFNDVEGFLIYQPSISAILPVEIWIGTVGVGTAFTSPSVWSWSWGQYALVNFLETETSNLRILAWQTQGIINIWSNYPNSWTFTTWNQTFVDPFTKLSITFTQAKPANTNIKYYYSLNDGDTWTEYTVASGTFVTVTSSYQVKLRIEFTTTDVTITPSVNEVQLTVQA